MTVTPRDHRPPRSEFWRETERRAQKAYNRWYDAEPTPGEEDSLSYDMVREFFPDLIAALHSAASVANHWEPK